MNITELKAGEVTLVNKAKFDKTINIYVPNMYGVFYKIPAGKTMTITTLSAGESFTYLAQGDEDLEVTLK